MGDGLPHTKCALSNGGHSCYCSNAAESSGSKCDSDAVSGPCVIGSAGCSCGEYSCETTTSGCRCDYDGSGGSKSCHKGGDLSRTRCCLHLSKQSVSCACDDFGESCDAQQGEFAVDSCDESIVASALREASRLVTTCSR